MNEPSARRRTHGRSEDPQPSAECGPLGGLQEVFLPTTSEPSGCVASMKPTCRARSAAKAQGVVYGLAAGETDGRVRTWFILAGTSHAWQPMQIDRIGERPDPRPAKHPIRHRGRTPYPVCSQIMIMDLSASASLRLWPSAGTPDEREQSGPARPATATKSHVACLDLLNVPHWGSSDSPPNGRGAVDVKSPRRPSGTAARTDGASTPSYLDST